MRERIGPAGSLHRTLERTGGRRPTASQTRFAARDAGHLRLAPTWGVLPWRMAACGPLSGFLASTNGRSIQVPLFCKAGRAQTRAEHPRGLLVIAASNGVGTR
jgi:hypothetical protein